MSSRRNRDINLPAPYLRRIWLDPERIPDRKAYPFCLPFLHDDFSLSFDRAITIIAGENGSGKSTLLEGLAVMAGFDETGGGKAHRQDRSWAIEEGGGELTVALRASWVPKVNYGWFFRAETFFTIARYLDRSAQESGPFGGPPPAPGLLHLRRAGIRAVAQAPDGISEAAASHGQVGALSRDHGDAFAGVDGLPQRDAAGIHQIRAGADHRRTDLPLPRAAGVFYDPKGFVEAAIEE